MNTQPIYLAQPFLGAVMKTEREEAGLTLVSAARKCGLPAARLKNVEQGYEPVALQRVAAYMERMGRNAEWLKETRQ